VGLLKEGLAMDFLWFLLVGLAAGWLAGQIMKGGSLGLIGNLVIGVVGAILGGAVFRALNIQAYGLLGKLVMAVVGAVLLLWLLGLITKKKR
jgi:uncharacterized membrane protein YeaQ/YmgE (transglycosylase-associated protein family)